MPRIPKEGWEITPERMSLVKLQVRYCKKADIPVAIPLSGYCSTCGYDLVDHFGEHLGKQFVKGCPSCRARYSSIFLDYSAIL